MYEDVCVYMSCVHTRGTRGTRGTAPVFGVWEWCVVYKKKNRELNLIYKWTTGMAINSETSPPSFVSFYLQR